MTAFITRREYRTTKSNRYQNDQRNQAHLFAQNKMQLSQLNTVTELSSQAGTKMISAQAYLFGQKTQNFHNSTRLLTYEVKPVQE